VHDLVSLPVLTLRFEPASVPVRPAGCVARGRGALAVVVRLGSDEDDAVQVRPSPEC
jgi:hypothetical protein